jgi:hypothetical protein
MIPEDEVAWSKRQHALMKLGGVWGVPRSGLMMRKTETGFELHELMPYTMELGEGILMGLLVPGTAEELKAWQREDFACIQKRFEAAGLTFTDPKGLLK